MCVYMVVSVSAGVWPERSIDSPVENTEDIMKILLLQYSYVYVVTELY
jgi:hypothetical protein